MALRNLLVAAAIAAFASPASAAVLVVGNSSARMCYEAADAPTLPTASDLARCNSALADDALTSADIVATRVNRGIVLLRRHRVDDALADFDVAMRIDPNEPEAYLNKAIALLGLQHNDQALQLFDSAIAHNTRRPDLAYFGRAIANETLGNIRAAYDDYRQASVIRPGWRDPQIELTRFRVAGR